MKNFLRIYLLALCVTLPAIGNAAQYLCGAGIIIEIAENHNGTADTVIYLQNTEGGNTVKLRDYGTRSDAALSIQRDPKLSLLTAAFRTGMPIRTYSATGGSTSCGYINEVRVCKIANDCK